ncbi:Gfo/Idh/MocA family protein [Acetivibrio sp. MSJd-27]|uniref:Gfo/Idh/MocA family protein n=1 Tax=Acetivibrio sp. MSJd-27 TaxID=2841523 RepID=UPI001C10A517|nr:Gfo/Idh/MocA family oxidoreductase [Acetivibrio sp. MSJd-27]MBU5449543.1 Gfo/Idh/MocA family oxidoreductase [Acetivibrio sp. MSJd-27]
MKKELRWAVLGTGVIANEMAQALTAMGKPLYAVGNRTLGKALAFAEKHQVRKVYRDFHEMFWDPLVDIIYITTPHNTHIDFLRTALKNGKHVLCEKSITLNSNELREAVTLAENHDVILAEAMTIWHMPLYQKLWNMVKSGTLGKVQMLQLNFGSLKEYNMNSRFFNLQLAGGALLDIGVYALSLVRSFMDSQPEDILSQVKLASTGVDEQAGILLMNREEQMAAISLSLHSKQPKRAVISCERAYIEIMEYPRADKAVIVDAETGKRQEITEGKTAHALQYEIMDMEKAVLNHSVDSMHLAETIDVMEIMTKLRRDWGLQYPDE